MQDERFISQMREMGAEIDMDFVMREVRTLTDIEYGQTFKCRAASADYIEALLKKEGLLNVERVDFKADGKATYQDKRLPMGWEVSHAKLTVLSKVADLESDVIADYESCPFSIIWGSVSTAPGGTRVRIIAESEVYAGEDARGALILLEPSGRCCSEVISPLLDLGAIGFITEAVVGGMEAPDSVTWINCAVDDSMHWHVQSEDRDFIGFSISARNGRALRAAVHKGSVWAKIESDAYRHEDGKVSLLSATIPGESEKEFWVMAHLFEPLATDNASGVIGAIAIAKLIQKMILEGRIKKPRYTLRLLFTMELYGFAAAAHHFGGYLGDRAIGGLNIDAMPIAESNKKVALYVSPHSTPFCLNYLIVQAFRIFEKAYGGLLKISKYGHASYGDDCSLNDATVGLPTVWALHDCEPRYHFHHNSIRNADFIDVPKYNAFLSALAFLITKAIAPTAEEVDAFSENALEIAKENLERVHGMEYSETEQQSRMSYFLDAQKSIFSTTQSI